MLLKESMSFLFVFYSIFSAVDQLDFGLSMCFSNSAKGDVIGRQITHTVG